MTASTVPLDLKSMKITIADSVAVLTFSQPGKANAMTREFWKELPLALDELETKSDLRALIIAGEGKHFSSGMDLSVFAGNESLNNATARERERLRKLVLELQSLFSRLERLPYPVIAAVKGACIGAAFDLVCACDLRYASKDAYFCVQETNLAMMADLGVLQRLPKLIPAGIARELCFTGDRLSAERALALGLLSAVFDSDAEMETEVKNLALRIAAKSPLAIAASKEALNYSRDNSVELSLAHSAVLQSAIMDPGEIAKAAQAAAKKSEASYDSLLAKGQI